LGDDGRSAVSRRAVHRHSAGSAGFGLGRLPVLFNPLAFDWHDRCALFGNPVLPARGAALGSEHSIRRAAPFDLILWEIALAVLAPLTLAIDGRPAIVRTPNLVLLLLHSALPGSAIAFRGAVIATQNLPAAATPLRLLAVSIIGIVASNAIFGKAPNLSLGIAVAMIIGGIAPDTLAPSGIEPAGLNQRD